MNKYLWLVLALVVIGGLLWWGQGKKQVPLTGEPITIGVVLPMTGIAANYGEHQSKAIELAVEEINESGGIDGRPLKIVLEDDGTDPKKTVSAVQKLISIDQTPVIIGAVWDFLANAAIPVIDSQKVVLVSPSAAPDTLEKTSPYFFTTFPPIALDQGVFEDYLRSKPAGQRIAVVYINNAWGHAHRDTFMKALANVSGHTVVKEVELPKFDGNDMQREMSLLKQLEPAVIFTAVNLSDPEILIKKNKELGLNAEIVSHPNTAANYFNGNLSAAQMEGLIVYQLARASDTFVKKYVAKYDKEPISEADSAYDAVYVIKEALEKSGGDYTPDSIRAGLKQITDYEGATGRIDYSANNYPLNKTPYLEVFRDGQFVKIN